jgi:hypothetical protein
VLGRGARVFALVALATSGIVVPPATHAGATIYDNHYEWSLPSGNVWKYNQALTVAQAPPSTFWSSDAKFTNGEGTHLGIQTNGNLSCSGCGTAAKAAVFSIFGSSVYNHSSVCSNGADGGPGATCVVSYNWVVNHEYQLQMYATPIANFTAMRWIGQIRDVTGSSGWTNIAYIDVHTISAPVYHIENFTEPWTIGCPSLAQPAFKVFFYSPELYHMNGTTDYATGTGGSGLNQPLCGCIEVYLVVQMTGAYTTGRCIT